MAVKIEVPTPGNKQRKKLPTGGLLFPLVENGALKTALPERRKSHWIIFSMYE